MKGDAFLIKGDISQASLFEKRRLHDMYLLLHVTYY